MSPGCISIKVLLKPFCRSQLPHRSVNLSFTITNLENKLTDLYGNRLLQNDFEYTLCEINLVGLPQQMEITLRVLAAPRRPRFQVRHLVRNVDVRLPGKGNSNSHGAWPVHLIITMIKWIRTSRLSIKNSLSRHLACSKWRLPSESSPRPIPVRHLDQIDDFQTSDLP